jgi:hypothetical protein
MTAMGLERKTEKEELLLLFQLDTIVRAERTGFQNIFELVSFLGQKNAENRKFS